MYIFSEALIIMYLYYEALITMYLFSEACITMYIFSDALICISILKLLYVYLFPNYYMYFFFWDSDLFSETVNCISEPYL